MKRLTPILLALFCASPVAACGAKSYSGPVIAGSWRTSPEDLPYSGKTPVVKTVTFNLILHGERDEVSAGKGSISPFYSSDAYEHAAPDPPQSVSFDWAAAPGHVTLILEGEGKSTCTGDIAANGATLTFKVAGCPPLAAAVSQETVIFARAR